MSGKGVSKNFYKIIHNHEPDEFDGTGMFFGLIYCPFQTRIRCGNHKSLETCYCFTNEYN